MTQDELRELLDHLIAGWENEVVEFKAAQTQYSVDKAGEYVSALANEASLRGFSSAWLVLGVDNSRQVTGTSFAPSSERRQLIKQQIQEGIDQGVTFREIHELNHPSGRVLLCEIPAAPRGIPISWKGDYRGRAGESLVSLGLDKLDEIRNQTLSQDWSAALIPAASIADLDAAALVRARLAFAQRNSNRFSEDEVRSWSDEVFLDRARITLNGRITRTALLLLGRRESAHFLSPHLAEMTWKLVGQEQAYEHFGLPFFLNTTELYRRIRNIQIRIQPADELIAYEVAKYDERIVLEALHNCIAHQDYSQNARIVVTEHPDRLVLDSRGSFFEGAPDDYVAGDKTPARYRNPFLVQAMTELNMIDHMGYGIHQINQRQASRYLPLPDYDLSQSDAVQLTIYGGVIDLAFTRLLMQRADLPLMDVFALDRVQKKLPISDDAVQRLRRARLIEGRRPHLHVAADVAAAMTSKADYIRTRGQDDAHYMKLITDLIDQYGSATRKEINDLLWNKLSDALSEEEKENKVSNLLTKMRRSKQIWNSGSRSQPSWRLV